MTTPHPPEAVQALIDAVDAHSRATTKDVAFAAIAEIHKARENLRPKPTMVPVLPEEPPEWWVGFSNAIYAAGRHGEGMHRKDFYIQLRTLTSVPEKPEPWRMPKFDDLADRKDGSGVPYIRTLYANVYEPNYAAIYAKIHAMNKETP